MPPSRIRILRRMAAAGCRRLIVGLFVGSVLGILTATAATDSRPNFIFVLIDDMGYGDLSCYGGKPALTPNIDSLAREGIRFTQFYVGSPICSPSRTAFTTGQFPARWRITSYLAARAENERAAWLNGWT